MLNLQNSFFDMPNLPYQDFDDKDIKKNIIWGFIQQNIIYMHIKYFDVLGSNRMEVHIVLQADI